MRRTIIFLAASVVINSSASGQWVLGCRLADPPAAFFAHDSDLFISISGHGVSRFTPRHNSLVRADSGMFPSETDKGVQSFAAIGNYLFAGGGGVCRSTNNGETWMWLTSTI